MYTLTVITEGLSLKAFASVEYLNLINNISS